MSFKIRATSLVIGTLFMIGAAAGVYYRNHTPPTKHIGQLSIGNLTREQVEQKVNAWIISTPVELRLPDRTLSVTYANLGLFADYSGATPQLKLNTKSVVIPLNPEVNTAITYDPTIKQFVSLPTTYEEVIDASDLLPQATANLGQKNPVLTPISYRKEHTDNQVVTLNAKLINAFEDGIVVKVKDGKEFTTVNLSPEQVLNLLTVTQSDNPQLSVNSSKLASTVLAQLTPKQQADFQTPTAVQNTTDLLNQRFDQATSRTTVLGIDSGPSSDGSVASRYIEVDLSQQRLYFFLKGTVYKSYPVSTGSEYPTPPGEYHILNKAPLAFSNIYGVWMPYWMAFSYQNDIGASLGIHEIAYQEGNKGERVYRYGNYIGDRKTGGCIALEPDAAKEIYNLSQVGMLVRVVE